MAEVKRFNGGIVRVTNQDGEVKEYPVEVGIMSTREIRGPSNHAGSMEVTVNFVARVITNEGDDQSDDPALPESNPDASDELSGTIKCSPDDVNEL